MLDKRISTRSQSARAVHNLPIFTDAFEQKPDENVLLKAIINSAADGVMVISQNGTILIANPACEKLFGYSILEMASRNVSMLGLPPIHNQKGANNHEDTGRRKNGTTFPLYLSVGEALQNSETFFVLTIHDLTERKQKEEQLAQTRKMQAVGQLSGGIAHDFNNLLTIIIGNTDLIAENLKKSSELRHLCSTIIDAASRGAELTNRLLSFGRRQMLQPAAIDCGKLIDDMEDRLREVLSKDISIRVFAEANPSAAFVDPTQLQLAITNLSLNAGDAMPYGGHLTITVSNAFLDRSYQTDHPEVRPGHYVMISITDDGEGMPPEIQSRAFEPFFTTKEIGKGSGLGLSMAYGFVKQSSGHIAIYSEPGLGTTVRIYLPASISVKSSEVVAPVGHIIDWETLHGTETVLVVEDDPFVRCHAVTSLKSFGYNVLTASDGREALARICQDSSIDILFSDVVMPGGLSGCELAEQAHKFRSDLKILLTSGYPTETLNARFPRSAQFDVLNKPYRKLDLGRCMREMLDKAANDYLGIGVPLLSTESAASPT